MKRSLVASKIWTRHLHSTTHRRSVALGIQSADPSSRGHVDIGAFQERAFIPEIPFIFRKDAGSPAAHLPAAQKWFGKGEATAGSGLAQPTRRLSAYMDAFQEWPFPYELVKASAEKQQALVRFQEWLLTSQEMTDQMLAGILQPALTEAGEQSFFQLYAPLKLLMKAIDFNHRQGPTPGNMLELYVAQSSLSDLPQPLQDDLPTPELVACTGKGDVYSSSVWIGTEPTYTPLHRDPNPNLFCQLCSRKMVRLLPPAVGDRLFFEVQVQIRQQGNSRIRTADMMQGKEREALHDAVWANDSLDEQVYEAEVNPGDALFIPKGWWHSIKSVEKEGQLNCSVNWWFR